MKHHGQRTRRLASLAMLALVGALAGCDSDHPGSSGGSGGAAGGGGGGGGMAGAGGSAGSGGIAGHTGGGGSGGGDSCPEEAKLIYTVDQNNTFASFNPVTATFTNIGTLACTPQGSCQHSARSTPFSMGVDRSATAWVLYCSGELFRVDARTAACQSTTFAVNQMNFQVFGMGFASDQPMATAETLFVAGGQYADINNGAGTLGRLSFPQLTVARIGGVPGWPELTGTGDAQLWGFFPGTGGRTPQVTQLDKSTGAASAPSYMLSDLTGPPAAWAFAFWGDGFYLFLRRQNGDASTRVFHVGRQDGAFSEVLDPSGRSVADGRTIVGAGVSTCAPVVGIQR
jgi:hypothetical protein